MKNTIFRKTSHSEEETRRIGYELAKDLSAGDIILLKGEMGAGKTAFVKGVAQRQNTKEATSPTFAIINEYYGDSIIYHMDLYRIEKFEELFNTGFEEYLNSDGIVLIEWPNIAMPILTKYDYKIIQINKINDFEREIVYTSAQSSGE